MIYILAGIIGSVALIGAADLIVKVWDKLDPPEKKAAPVVGATEAARWNRLYTPVSTSTIPKSGGKHNANFQ